MIIIDPNTRQFNIPGADLVFGVESDAGSERKHFQAPRYVGNNLDLASCFVRMNFRNANGDMDSYLVDDVAVAGENVTFSWVLSQKAVKYKGQVKFVVCAVGPNQKVEWHTTLGSGMVLEGLEPDAAVVPSGTADVVAQLIAMVEAQTAAVEAEGGKQIKAVQAASEAAEAAAVAQIEAKGASTLATIPGEYTAVQNAVRGMANAIRGRASGEVIRVDDVSPVEHYPVVKVTSRNLFNIGALETMPESYTTRISAVDTENNTFTITTADTHTGNGYCGLTNAAGNYVTTLRDLCPQMEAGKTYTLSGNTGTATKTLYLRGVNVSWVFGKSMMITEEHLDAKVAMYGLNSAGGEGTGDCVISNLQIEEGAVVTEYTPYIDPTTVTVTRCGKNVLKPSGSKFQNGVTLTMDENGVYTIAGTTTSSINLSLGNMILKAGCKYKPTIHLYSGSIVPSFWSFAAQANMYKDKDGCLVSDTDTTASSFIYASGAGSTYDAKFTIMVEIINDENTDEYELYNGEEQIPAADGTVSGLTAASPTMTLMTDTAGVNIECEYSRDTNAVIAEIMDKLAALTSGT